MSWLEKLIDISQFAPSGMNAQPVGWLVISDTDRIKRIAEMSMEWLRSFQTQVPLSYFRGIIDRTVDSWDSGTDSICRSAPCLIITHAPKGKQGDCTIALAYMELTAPSFGLGVCWAGWLRFAANNWESLQQDIALPEGRECCGALMIGYAKYEYHRIPLRNAPQITWQ